MVKHLINAACSLSTVVANQVGFKRNNTMSKLYTLLMLVRENTLLLGMKKRGFGVGKWNGFGGKVNENESIVDACQRELQEEAGITANDATCVGRIIFEFEGEPLLMDVRVFRATAFTGEVTESEEMLPQWFAHDAIPFQQMWLDDRLWLPILLRDGKFAGYFLFRGHEQILHYCLQPITSSESSEPPLSQSAAELRDHLMKTVEVIYPTKNTL